MIDAPAIDAPAADTPVLDAPEDGPVRPPGFQEITITFDGGAPGFAFISASPPTDAFSCRSSCKFFVAPGTEVTVHGYTPSTFGGWAGACNTNDHECRLGTVNSDQKIVASFLRDEREVATLLPERRVTGVALTADGNVAVADVTGVSKLALTGDVVWTAPIAGALDLATDAAGNIYGRTAATLFAVSSAGAVKWIHPVDTVDTVEDSPQSFESAVAASPDGSVIAVLTDDGAVVVDGDGAPRFTVLGQFAEGLAVGPDGTVAITVPSAVFIEQDDVLRYTADGMPLATLGPLPGNADPSIAFDPQGFVCANTTGHSEITLSRMAPDGTVVFEQTAFVRSGAGIAAGVLASSASEVIGVHAVNNSEIVTGLQIDVLAPDGTPTWSHTKVGGEVFIGLLADAPTPTGVASSGKRFAVAGTYGGNFPWIQIYELP